VFFFLLKLIIIVREASRWFHNYLSFIIIQSSLFIFVIYYLLFEVKLS